ncbi:MAG: ribonuclease P protein component 1 [Candidatus Hydrothermarchaeales archaeon]
MMVKIRPREITKHELIGLQCIVSKASDPSLVGYGGEVVDETRNILILRKGRKERKIPKKNATFRFALGERTVDVEGSVLVGRPEDRIKKHIPRLRGKVKVNE